MNRQTPRTPVSIRAQPNNFNVARIDIYKTEYGELFAEVADSNGHTWDPASHVLCFLLLQYVVNGEPTK